MDWYVLAFKQAIDFSGRAGRPAFWWFMLIHLLVSAVFMYLEVSTHIPWWPDILYSLIILLPFVSIVVRRMRDTGLSLLWFLVILIPAFGIVALLIILALPSREPPMQEVAQ